ALRAIFAEESEKAYYDWLGNFGLLLGLGLILLQPIGGWFYARQIQLASPEAFARIMTGEQSRLFLLQTFLFGTVLLLSNLYLVSAVGRGEPAPETIKWMKRALWVIGMLFLLGIVPKEWPLGQMRPW